MRASPQRNATHHIRCERTVVLHCTNKQAKKQTSVKTARSAKVAEIKLVGSLQQHLYKAIGSELIISSTHLYIKHTILLFSYLFFRNKPLVVSPINRVHCLQQFLFLSCIEYIRGCCCLRCLIGFLLSSVVRFLPERRYCQIKRVFLYSSCVQRHLCLVEQLQTRWLQLAACHLFTSVMHCRIVPCLSLERSTDAASKLLS